MNNNNQLITDLQRGGLPKSNFIKSLSSLVNPYTGIINAILERSELREYGFYMYQNIAANSKVLFELKKERLTGGLGVNRNRVKAFEACLSEALERYSLAYIPKKGLLRSKYADLPHEHRPSKDFHLYTRKQYRKFEGFFVEPVKNDIEWTKINSYRNTQRYIYWPASLIYVPYGYGPRVAEQSSSGVAAHKDVKTAVQSATLEMIERECIAINFLKRLNPPEVDLQSIQDAGLQKIFRTLRKEGKDFKIYQLYSDLGAPCFVSLIWRNKDTDTKRLHCGIGASCALDSDIALEKSVKEALFTYFYSKNLLDLRPKTASDIKSLYEHLLYYQDAKKFPHLLFTSTKIKYQRVKISFGLLVKQLELKGLNIYFKEVTAPDIISSGIHVIRVIIPGVVELNSRHVLPRKAAKRFNELPRLLKLKNVPKSLSRLPHPFP